MPDSDETSLESAKSGDGESPRSTAAESSKSADDEAVFASVIVPVYEDPAGVAQTLRSLVEQTYSRERHEIVVVDNDSTDDTRSVVRSYAREHDHVTMAVEDDVQSSYAARNTGVRESSGTVCAFVDADMTVEEDWLESVVERFRKDDVAYLGCDVEIRVPPGEETVFARYNRASGFPVEYDIEVKRFAPTCCLSVRRSVFEEVGTFDQRLTSGGDYEFGNRVSASGVDLHYAPDIVQYHPARSSLRSLVKKSLRQGRGVGQLQRYYPDRYGRPGIPPRPDGSHVDSTDDESIPSHERVVFELLGLLLLAVRGVGYYGEVLFGTDDE